MLREGSGEPLVLFHGIISSERVWRARRAAAGAGLRHDRANCARPPGRAGCRASTRRPSTISSTAPRASSTSSASSGPPGRQLAGGLDGAGAGAPRPRAVGLRVLAGRLLGRRLARPGAGASRSSSRARRDARRGRRIAPLLARSRRFRRWAMRERLPPRRPRSRASEFLDLQPGHVGCDIAEELIVPGTRWSRWRRPAR